MNHYIDCHILPNEGMTEPVLLAAVFNQVHIALVECNQPGVGVSFPAAGQTLGGTLRLHGAQAHLGTLELPTRLARLQDHTTQTAIQAVPESHSWIQLKRVQPKLSAAKLRRLVKRGSLTAAEAEKRLTAPNNLTLPYLQLTSSSTGQRFRLFVDQLEATGPDHTPQFNNYGLGSPVPAF